MDTSSRRGGPRAVDSPSSRRAPEEMTTNNSTLPSLTSTTNTTATPTTTATNNNSQLSLVSDVLSRSILYTPFKAYDQSVIEPSLYLKQCRTIPKSIHEHSVIDFYHDISKYFHIQGGLDGQQSKYAKPLYKNDISKQLELRALTLVGGGFHAGGASRNKTKNSLFNKKPEVQSSIQCKLLRQSVLKEKKKYRTILKRKRKLLQSSSGHSTKSDNKKHRRMNNNILRQENALSDEFLKQMNEKWNKYAWSVINLLTKENVAQQKQEQQHMARLSSSKNYKDRKKGQSVTPSIPAAENNNNNADSNNNCMINDTGVDCGAASYMADRLLQPFNRCRFDLSMEYVGSRVRIQSCHSHRNYEGLEGIVIVSTTNAWKIATIVDVPEMVKKPSTTSDDEIVGAVPNEDKMDDQRHYDSSDQLEEITELNQDDIAYRKEVFVMQEGTKPAEAVTSPSVSHIKLVVVPKKKTSLVVLLPFQQQMTYYEPNEGQIIENNNNKLSRNDGSVTTPHGVLTSSEMNTTTSRTPAILCITLRDNSDDY